MIIYGVYVITNDGRTILSENFQSSEEVPDALLFGGLLTALQNFTAEMTKARSGLRSIDIGGLSYHIRSFGLIYVVLVTNVTEMPTDVIQMLGLRFINEYGDTLLNWDSNVGVFLPFKDTILEIVGKETAVDESRTIDPTKKLTPGEIFSLPHSLQPTALALIQLEEGSTKDFAKISGQTIKSTKRDLTTLQKMGFVGRKQKEKGKSIFFCSLY
jgi:hypothetical protein